MIRDSKEIRLIQAVVADPDADAPRLAYADWLDAHGRQPRGRLIRLQCEIEAMQAEEATLLHNYSNEWGMELSRLGAKYWKFHRGFPEEIEIRSDDLLKHYPDLNEITPISRLHLSPSDQELALLSQRPQLRQLRELSLGKVNQECEDVRFGIDGIRALGSSRSLVNLRSLKLQSPLFGREALTAITESPTFENLETLAFRNPGPAPHFGIMDLLVSSPVLTRLKEFEWGDDHYGPKMLDHGRQRKMAETPFREHSGRS